MNSEDQRIHIREMHDHGMIEQLVPIGSPQGGLVRVERVWVPHPHIAAEHAAIEEAHIAAVRQTSEEEKRLRALLDRINDIVTVMPGFIHKDLDLLVIGELSAPGYREGESPTMEQCPEANQERQEKLGA
jgi:hypothetical protein